MRFHPRGLEGGVGGRRRGRVAYRRDSGGRRATVGRLRAPQ